MKVKLFSLAVFTLLLLSGCGGGGGDTVVDDGDKLVTVLPDGESSLTTTEQIESVLANNSEIKEGQTVAFVLPQEKQTLVLTSDLVVKGDLLIK